MADFSGTSLLKAPAKLNLSLDVLGRRPDGYHELVSLVGFADLHDVVTVAPGDGAGDVAEDVLSVSGRFGAGLAGNNLVLQAVRAFRDAVAPVPPLRIALEKSIPVAAGLGGGSADAAAILRWLATSAGLAPNSPPVLRIAAGLGADIPVCLDSRLRYMRGTGTELEAALPERAPIPLLMVNPGVPVPTGPVFGALAAPPLAPDAPPRQNAHGDAVFEGTNDLEKPARKVAPVVGEVLSALKALDGSRGARLSGSGATCFALFDSQEARDAAASDLSAAQPDWWLHAGMLMSWSPAALEG